MQRYVVNCDFTSQRLTGVQRYSFEMLKRLIYDERIEISCFTNNTVLPEFEEVAEKIKVVRCNRIIFRQLIIPVLSFRQKLITFSGTPTFLKKNQILTIHDLAPIVAPDAYSKLYRIYFKIGLMFATNFLTEISVVSDFTRRELFNYASKMKSIVRIHPNGHEHLIRKLNFGSSVKEENFFLVIGNNHHNKNLKVVIDTYEKYGDTHDLPKIKVLGRFEENKVFNSQELSYPSGIEVISNPSDELLLSYIIKSSALIIPSLYEGFGIPLLEAILHHKRVICSNLEVFNEIAGDYPCYFDPKSTDSLLYAINKMHLTPIREDLRKKILKKYSWQSTVDGYINDFINT
jgi:glycosyltransferase involved in cell wall biosynthesis